MTGRTRDEFHRSAPQRQIGEPEIHRLRVLQQAEVSADRLTGDPDWDVFTSYIQAAIDSTEKQKRAAEDRLRAPDVVDHLEILRIKIALAECVARIEAWTAAVRLPALIKKSGSDAKDLMAKFETGAQ